MKLKRYTNFITEEIDQDIYNAEQDVQVNNPAPIANREALRRELFTSCTQNISIQLCQKVIDSGFDIDFDNGLAMRAACRQGKLDVIKFIIEKSSNESPTISHARSGTMSGGGWLKNVKVMPLCWAAECGHKEVIDWFISQGMNYSLDRPMAWLQHSRSITRQQQYEVLDYIQSIIDSGEGSISDEAKTILDNIHQQDSNINNFADYIKSNIAKKLS